MVKWLCGFFKICFGLSISLFIFILCSNFSGMINVKCHEKFKRCIKKVQKSGKVGFSRACPYDTAVPTMVQGMDMAILLSQFGGSKLELWQGKENAFYRVDPLFFSRFNGNSRRCVEHPVFLLILQLINLQRFLFFFFFLCEPYCTCNAFLLQI